LNTNNLITNRINPTQFTVFVTGADVSNLKFHVSNSNYYVSNLAPSFIDRLEGKKTANANGNGIESFVDLEKLSNQGIHVEQKSNIDYIYFSNDNPAPIYGISGMPYWFKIDDAHVDKYGVRNLIVP
jgi:hypothetical protein